MTIMTGKTGKTEEKASLASRAESVLFLHGEPIPRKKLASLLGTDPESLTAALGILRERYAAPGSGLSLLEHDGSVELATAAANAETVSAFVSAEREEGLGKASLETLAIVAYRGPVSRGEIDAVRGVNSSSALRNLLLRGLVDREPNPLDAREYRYAASFRLLELLGVSSVAELPDFETLSTDARLGSAIAFSEEIIPTDGMPDISADTGPSVS